MEYMGVKDQKGRIEPAHSDLYKQTIRFQTVFSNANKETKVLTKCALACILQLEVEQQHSGPIASQRGQPHSYIHIDAAFATAVHWNDASTQSPSCVVGRHAYLLH